MRGVCIIVVSTFAANIRIKYIVCGILRLFLIVPYLSTNIKMMFYLIQYRLITSLYSFKYFPAGYPLIADMFRAKHAKFFFIASNDLSF